MIYVSIDFESFSAGTWSTFGLLAVSYPEMDIVYHMEVGCVEPQVDVVPVDISSDGTDTGMVDTLTTFWNLHAAAREYNKHLNKLKSLEEAEACIVAAITTVREMYPNFYLVCDNPSFDIKLLDGILQKYKCDPVCLRPPHRRFFQSVCVWSYRLAMVRAGIHVPTNTEISTYAVSFLKFQRKYIPFGPKHTPLFDCAHTIIAFQCMNGNKFYPCRYSSKKKSYDHQ
jgi:hypothetical protein